VGRAKFGPPPAPEDAARLGDITPLAIKPGGLTLRGRVRRRRNIFPLPGAGNIADCMAELRRMCNNNGEIDDSGQPDFSVLCEGDYIDGISLAQIAAGCGRDSRTGPDRGVCEQPYRDCRVQHIQERGDTETTKNHIVFTFANIPLKTRMNATNTCIGGYAASEARAFIEGVNGDGTGDKSGVTTAAFLNALLRRRQERITLCP